MIHITLILDRGVGESFNKWSERQRTFFGWLCEELREIEADGMASHSGLMRMRGSLFQIYRSVCHNKVRRRFRARQMAIKLRKAKLDQAKAARAKKVEKAEGTEYFQPSGKN